MTAYFMQELILEPFAGLVFSSTPGESTRLSGAQNGGVFVGMISVGFAASALRLGSLRFWVITGCLGSAASLVAISFLGLDPTLSLLPAVVTMGFFNGMFAVAAIASMMQLAGEGRKAREGTRMGLWGASQAIAAGFGGLLGAALVDVLRSTGLGNSTAYGTVFVLEAGLFCVASVVAARILTPQPATRLAQPAIPGE